MHYDKYFGRNQKVFLINISEERDEAVFNSFTGKILICDEDKILLKTAYRLYSGDVLNLKPGMQFKLTTESMGMGVQIRAELVELISSEELKLRPLGELSVYQRRQTPRADVTLPLLHVPQKSSLAAFQREWKRVVSDLHKAEPPRLKCTSTNLNISAGGVRLDLSNEPTHLALLVIDLQDEKPPACAVAETVWQQRDEEQNIIRCGHRFVEILKEDQERIAAVVEKIGGGRTGEIKCRELIDRMVP
jgi:c-di-GMP-binding flagellar brake protein YcgR